MCPELALFGMTNFALLVFTYRGEPVYANMLPKLSRLDLRPPGEKEDGVQVDETQMPPPLDLDDSDNDAASVTQRSRASRFFDLTRLRHASPEERIQALRQFRHSQAQPSSTTGGETTDRGRRSKLADKLRDKFRIRTRPQSPDNRE